MTAPNPDRFPARGVYRADYVAVGGHPVLVAITSRGERSAELVIKGDMTIAKARRVLWRHLDNIDPLPRDRLRVVTGNADEIPVPRPRPSLLFPSRPRRV